MHVPFEVWKDIQDKWRTKSPCCLYSEPGLAERVVRDYLTEDIDRIFIDNQELFEVTRDVIQKYSRRSRNWIQLYGGDEPVSTILMSKNRLNRPIDAKYGLSQAPISFLMKPKPSLRLM